MALYMTVVAASLVGFVGVARANPEPPFSYDARVAGMAGIAVPTVENSTALFHNPSRLEVIERFSMTAVITSLLVNLRAPFAGPGTERDSGIQYAPLVFLGGAGRVHERVTVGLGVYVYTGFGGGYRNVRCIGYGTNVPCDDPGYPGRIDPPQNQEVFLFITEAAVPVQVTITDWLSVGLSLRLPWGRQQVRANQETPGIPRSPGELSFGRAEQTISGFGIPGILLGASVRVPRAPGLTIGFAYRSKVWVDMAGTTKATVSFGGGEPITTEIDTSTRWYVPHMLRFGVAYQTWKNRFTVAAELKAQFHRDANETQVFELASALAPTTVARFDWQNVYLGSLAIEVLALPRLPLRLGMSVGRSATNPETITPFSPPPGIQYGVYGGFGILIDPITVDLSAGWGGGPAYQRTATGALCTDIDNDARTETQGRRTLFVRASGGCPGTYDVDSYFISFSATYSL